MTGFIYAIEAENGLVKIGFTTSLTTRLSHLRANNCLELTPRGFIRGTEDDEEKIHARLSDECASGEWFRKGPLVTAFLAEIEAWPARDRRLKTVRAGSAVSAAIIRRFGGKKALAEALGLGVDAVKQWRLRGSIPGKHHLRLLQMAAERGIPLTESELAPDVQAFQ